MLQDVASDLEVYTLIFRVTPHETTGHKEKERRPRWWQHQDSNKATDKQSLNCGAECKLD